MEPRSDVIVVGAGPAGLKAAESLAQYDLTVGVIDENVLPGGQFYRQLPTQWQATHQFTHDGDVGAKLIESVFKRSNVWFVGGTTVWHIGPGPEVWAAGPAGQLVLRPRHVIMATGAYDLPLPVSGWTHPGVFTAGGALNLLKGQGVVPGSRVLIAGTGPLVPLLGTYLVRMGASVAIVDPVNPVRLVRVVWGLANVPSLVVKGALAWSSLLARPHTVSARFGWMPLSIDAGGPLGLVVRSSRVDADWRPVGRPKTEHYDSVILGYGLVPANELLRHVKAQGNIDPDVGTWCLAASEGCGTGVVGVSAAGDCRDVGGAAKALAEGELCGLEVSASLGTRRDLSREARLKAKLRRFRRFQSALSVVYRRRAGFFEAPCDAVVCRCEDVTFEMLSDAVSKGANSPSKLKAMTRVSMGPCQGKYCWPYAYRVLHRTGWTEDPSYSPVRPPVRPICLASFAKLDPASDIDRVPYEPPKTPPLGQRRPDNWSPE
jgi:thioredoxin reductase